MPYKDLEKQKQAQHESYLRNKEKVRVSTQWLRRRNVQYVQKLKESVPCMDCDNFYPHYVMDFDHRDRSEKTSMVSRLIRSSSLEKIQVEIDKCDLVCANCHRERSFKNGHWLPV